MKVKVISVFRDKFTGQYYNSGEVIEVSEESRVLDMENRRLGERVEVKVPFQRGNSKYPSLKRNLIKRFWLML